MFQRNAPEDLIKAIQKGDLPVVQGYLDNGVHPNARHLIQFAPRLFMALGSTGLLFHGHSHVHDHGTGVLSTNMNAAWLAAGSIFAKEWLYMTTMKIAKERNSSVLASNAVHHRIDSFTSIVTLVAIVGAHISSSYGLA